MVRGEDGLRVFDVYYDESGAPVATNASPSYVYGESLQDLDAQLDLMRQALTLPVLDEAEIGGGRIKASDGN